jgi:hypothetical protein
VKRPEGELAVTAPTIIMDPAVYMQQLRDVGQACHLALRQYLARGWCPIPPCNGGHVGVKKGHHPQCGSPGKSPLLLFAPLQKKRPTERDLLCWAETFPLANAGIVMGSVSGLIGIDVDGAGAEARLLELLGGVLPKTLRFCTSPGRYRLLFKIPPGVILGNPTIQTDDGELRFLAEGKLTVAPPNGT